MRLIAFTKDHRDFYANLPAAAGTIDVCPDETKDAVAHNNADIAILDGESFRALKSERNYRHLRELYLPLDLGFGKLCKALAYSARYLAARRLRPYATATLTAANGAQRRFLKMKIHSRKTRNSEFDYYPAEWTALDFLKFLDGLGARYVALRWHDKILHDLPMRDIDLLIADEDIKKVTQNLDGLVGRKKVHMHSVNGGEREKVDQMAYFPPKISRRIIENRVKLTDNVGFRPSDHDHFFSLAYHAVVDKGAASGLPEAPGIAADPENKYYKELKRLRDVLGLDVSIDLESLVVCLEKNHWLPPADRLAKFVARNEWLKKRMATVPSATSHINGDYTVMLIREIVREWGILPELLADLRKMGFQIVFEKELKGEEREHICTEIRGGNWSPGPWKTNGGRPFYALLLFDPKPIKMTRKQLTQFPFVQNARLLNKSKWREKVNARFPKAQQANFVHASDNTHEAYEYLSVIAPQAVDELMK